MEFWGQIWFGVWTRKIQRLLSIRRRKADEDGKFRQTVEVDFVFQGQESGLHDFEANGLDSGMSDQHVLPIRRSATLSSS